MYFTILRTDISNSRTKPAGLDFYLVHFFSWCPIVAYLAALTSKIRIMPMSLMQFKINFDLCNYRNKVLGIHDPRIS